MGNWHLASCSINLIETVTLQLFLYRSISNGLYLSCYEAGWHTATCNIAQHPNIVLKHPIIGHHPKFGGSIFHNILITIYHLVFANACFMKMHEKDTIINLSWMTKGSIQFTFRFSMCAFFPGPFNCRYFQW